MSTIGWVFILVAILIARQVAKGRVMNTGEDLADIFLAIAQGDTQGLAEVFSRTGDSSTATQADIAYQNAGKAAGEAANRVAAVSGNSILHAAVLRGTAAKGYGWSKTGPNYYDCSGLVWRALQDVGYKGPRFFTSNAASVKEFQQVNEPTVGDIVLWRKVGSGHMGIVSGNGQYYSARSVRSGIGYSSISSLTGKGAPRYYRYIPSNNRSANNAAQRKNQAA